MPSKGIFQTFYSILRQQLSYVIQYFDRKLYMFCFLKRFIYRDRRAEGLILNLVYIRSVKYLFIARSSKIRIGSIY